MSGVARHQYRLIGVNMAPLIMHAEKTVTIIMHHSRLQRLVTAHHRPKVTVIRVSARQDWAAQVLAQDIIQP